jgi:uncharacterized protein
MIKWLIRYLPKNHTIKNDGYLKFLGNLLHHPGLWRFARLSVARGVAVGLFVAFIPLPMQMLIAAVLAAWFKANIPIAMAMTWITNPLTFIPINYSIYRLGKWLLGENNKIMITGINWNFHNWHDFWQSLGAWFLISGKSFLVGLPIVAFSMAFIGYILTLILWRMTATINRYMERRKKA